MSVTNITIACIWHDMQDMDASHLADLAETINRSYAVRDAVLLASIDDTMDADTFGRIVEDPHGTKDEMERRLTHAYQHPDGIPRIRTRRIADGLAQEGKNRHLAHPLASAAYLHWIIGNYQTAIDLAYAALSIDEDTSLAAIVISAICRGIGWGSRRI